jgi:Lon protease-like protein
MSENERFLRGRVLPANVPLFPLPGVLLLPGGQLPLNIFEPRYLSMIDDALGFARLIGMVQPRGIGDGGKPPLYDIGCAGKITSFAETDDGRYLITLLGKKRFRILEELDVSTPYRRARVDWSVFPADALNDDPTTERIDRARLEAAMRRYLESEGLRTDWDAVLEAPTDALVSSLAMGCPFAPSEQQALLEAENARDRAACLIALMEMSSAGEAGGGDKTLQ